LLDYGPTKRGKGEMSAMFGKLFEPIKIGLIEIKNRVVMAPMGIFGLVNPDGSPSKRAIEYYIERARGGIGLIITGLFKVENEIDSPTSFVPLISDAVIAPFAELAEAVHALGSKIFVQLTAGVGRSAAPKFSLSQKPPVAPSPIPSYWEPRITCRELKPEEIEHIVSDLRQSRRLDCEPLKAVLKP
jgi:2-enoate reductase